MFSDLIGEAKPQRRITGAVVLTGVALLAIAFTTFLGARPLSAANAERQNPSTFLVYGSVHDTEGHPMADVDVLVSSGNGTLHRTGAGKTMADGTFSVKFAPGMPTLSTGPDIEKNRRQTGAGSGQAAIVRARKEGYYEVDLCRQGDLRMADYLPERGKDSILTVENTVLPDQPFHVSFVMASAAQVSGRLVDGEGKALANRKVTLKGDTLPPAQSVLDSTKTDADGQFSFSDVPLRPYWFEIEEIQSEPVEFNTPGECQVMLISREGAAPALVVESVVRSRGDGSGKEPSLARSTPDLPEGGDQVRPGSP